MKPTRLLALVLLLGLPAHAAEVSVAVAANFTGLPAISFPAGYDAGGLPVGFQAIGRPWSEHTLLRLANLAERVVERRKPQVYYTVLDFA